MSYSVRIRDNNADKEMKLENWDSPFIPAKGDLITLNDADSGSMFVGYVQDIGYSITAGFTPGDDRYPDEIWSETTITIFIGPKK